MSDAWIGNYQRTTWAHTGDNNNVLSPACAWVSFIAKHGSASRGVCIAFVFTEYSQMSPFRFFRSSLLLRHVGVASTRDMTLSSSILSVLKIKMLCLGYFTWYYPLRNMYCRNHPTILLFPNLHPLGRCCGQSCFAGRNRMPEA